MSDVLSEHEMREDRVPTPKSLEELTEYISSLVNRPHDYGTCIYAMSMAAIATFQYVASTLAVTVFQASCADMDFITRARSMKCPWVMLTADNVLYPQYDLIAQLKESMEKWKPWLKEQAKKKLAADTGFASPHVVAHWKKLAGEA